METTPEIWPNPWVAKPPRNEESVEAIAGRLYDLRIALGFEDNQAGFAKLVGISPQAWNNYETGDRRISLDQAKKVWRATGADLQWIYVGDASRLSIDLREALRSPPSGKKPRSRLA